MRAVTVTVASVLVAAGCSSDPTSSSESVAPTSTASVPDETTAPSPPPDSDPTTTVPTTTPDSDPTTTVPTTTPSSAVWTDADAYPSGYGAGCCGANATGSASPALTASPAALVDGTYAMDVVGWSPADPTRLQVSVRSFVPCADGVVDCSPMEDGTYGPDEVGFSVESRTIDVTLDDSVIVYLAGDDIDAAGPDLQSVLRSTNGIGLADLMTAIAGAYEAAIATPLRAGAAVDDIVADLQANPRLGFMSAAEQMTGLLYFRSGDAPAVLFQIVADQGEPLERSGTSELIPRTFTIQNAAITLEFYAGFRS
jgi:hypothetical protein